MSKSFIKTFGSKSYDLADYEQLHDWVEANVQFQMKRHPSRYAHKDPKTGEYTTGEANTNKLRLVILDNLIKQLEADSADSRIIASIRDQQNWLLGQHSSRQLSAKHRDETKEIAEDVYDAFVKACGLYRIDKLTEEEMAEAKEQLITACYNILDKTRWSKPLGVS